MDQGNEIRVTADEKEAEGLLDQGYELFTVVPVSQREIGSFQEQADIRPYDFILLKPSR